MYRREFICLKPPLLNSFVTLPFSRRPLISQYISASGLILFIVQVKVKVIPTSTMSSGIPSIDKSSFLAGTAMCSEIVILVRLNSLASLGENSNFWNYPHIFQFMHSPYTFKLTSYFKIVSPGPAIVSTKL